jgi:acyl-CoA synthetase (AMP-forming)/AMP-acid ligase II
VEVPLTPLEFMRRARRLYADREAVVDPSTPLGAGGETRWTYGQFFERCDRWSSALQTLGVVKCDRVAYIAPNTHAQLTSFYAVPQIGAVLVPINYRLVADDFRYLIQHSGATVVCVDRDYLDTVDALRPELPGVRHFVALTGARPNWLDYEALVREASGAVRYADIDERDLLTINYTSGTTSRPKGVMITHRNAWVNAIGTLVHVPMTPADRYLWTLPMFHANGWTFTWIVTAAGGTHVCLRKVEPAAIFALARQERISMLCAAPTILIGLASAPDEMKAGVPRGVRVLTAGAPPAAITIQRLEEGLGWSVTHVYGLTETAPFITVCEPRPEHASLSASERAVIKARQGVELITSGELRVVTESGEEVPRDGETMGEIVAHGNVVMEGYYNDPEATAKVIRDGWFHSGDAAVVHPDGYVEIRDRLKDVIISGGENISSVEVEAMLLRHPAVQEAAVVGLPDPKWGEAPHAWVVVKGGATVADGELRTFCRDNMAHFKVPHSFNVVAELPKTATGKIQKYVLRGGKPAITRQ